MKHNSSFTPLSYSVVIRTMGDSGDKYEALLRSIVNQTIQPEEVIVAIPDGYELDMRIGTETIIRAKKGMVSQRAEGISAAKSQYILVCDDDIEFNERFVEHLYDYLVKNQLDCVLPMEGRVEDDGLVNLDLRYPFLVRLMCAITGQMFQSHQSSSFLDVITTTAGHKVFLNSNIKDKCYYCETGNFQCFFIDTQKAKAVRLEEEIWLQQGSISTYSAYDDTSFFYKLFLQGGNIAYSLRTRYRHLDAGAGRRAKSKAEARTIRSFTHARNRTVFWHRFLWLPSTHLLIRRVQVLAGGIYAFINYTLLTIIINLHPKNWRVIKAMFIGYNEAYHIIKSKSIAPTGLVYRSHLQ